MNDDYLNDFGDLIKYLESQKKVIVEEDKDNKQEEKKELLKDYSDIHSDVPFSNLKKYNSKGFDVFKFEDLLRKISKNRKIIL